MRKSSFLLRKGYGILLLMLLMYSSLVFAQVRISGRITDGKGDPVAGTNIIIKNTNSGTASAADGSYQFTANLKNGEHQLVFSHIGYNTQERAITVSGGNPLIINITLNEDVAGLDEVVVTGTTAGTTRRQLGSYISTVKAEDLNRGATSNVLTALQGK